MAKVVLEQTADFNNEGLSGLLHKVVGTGIGGTSVDDHVAFALTRRRRRVRFSNGRPGNTFAESNACSCVWANQSERLSLRTNATRPFILRCSLLRLCPLSEDLRPTFWKSAYQPLSSGVLDRSQGPEVEVLGC